MYYNKNLADYPDSDIDIFIIGSDSVETSKAILHFINKTYKAEFSKDETVIDIKIKGYSRSIQIIVTQYQNINKLLYNFDAGYIKCALYLGVTYITFDAKYSMEKNMTHLKYFKHNRINKTLKKEIQIYNYNHSTILTNNMTTNKVCKKYYKCDNNFNVIAVKNFATYINIDTVDLDKTKSFRINKFYDVMIPDQYYEFKRNYCKPSENWFRLPMKFSYRCDYNLKYIDYMPVISQYSMITIVGKLILQRNIISGHLISIKIPRDNKDEIKKLFDTYDQICAVLNTKKTRLNCVIYTKCKTYNSEFSNMQEYYKNANNYGTNEIDTFIYCECKHNNNNNNINMSEYIDNGNYYESKKMYLINLNFSIKIGDMPCSNNQHSLFSFKYDIITLEEI